MFSQNSPSVFVYLIVIVAWTALVSCSGSRSMDSNKEETPCDNLERTCIYVTFDGTNCTVVGPTGNHTGEFTAIFSNEYEGEARLEVTRVKDGKTLQDLEEDTKNNSQ